MDITVPGYSDHLYILCITSRMVRASRFYPCIRSLCILCSGFEIAATHSKMRFLRRTVRCRKHSFNSMTSCVLTLWGRVYAHVYS